jgi:hypothetical protein
MQRIDPTTGLVADSAFVRGRILGGALLGIAFGSAIAVAVAVAARIPVSYDEGIEEPDAVELREPMWEHAILRVGDFPMRSDPGWHRYRHHHADDLPPCPALHRCPALRAHPQLLYR